MSAALAAAALVLGLAPAFAHAHGGGGRLVLEPGKVPPGGTVLVRGEDLPADVVVTLAFVGVAGRIELGAETTDGEGHFTLGIVVPGDVEEGTYRIEAVVGPEELASVRLEISGRPIESIDGEAGRDDDDPLLIALPPGWPGPASDLSASTPPAVVDGSTVRPSADPAALFLAVAGIAAFVVAGGLVARRRLN